MKVVIDTNVYIDWINAGKYRDLILARGFVKYLSTVVMMELLAGAVRREDRRILERMARAFESAGRLLVPVASDYERAGNVLRELRQRRNYGSQKIRALVNDVLIAVSARRIGAWVITQNTQDFQAIHEVFKFNFISV